MVLTNEKVDFYVRTKQSHRPTSFEGGCLTSLSQVARQVVKIGSSYSNEISKKSVMKEALFISVV